MDYMFYYAQAFNGDLSGWNVSGVSYMAGMFLYAKSFNQNLCSWADGFPYNSASSIFAESNCTYRSDPLLFRGGSFCASMCADLPFILDVLPSDASDTGGIKIRLLGYNFVSSHATNTSTSFECQFGSAAKVNASLISNKELNCVSPIVSLLNGALEVDLFVIIDGQMSFNSVPFQFYGLCPENQCNNGYCSFGQCEVSLHTVVATF
jgi:surface protein